MADYEQNKYFFSSSNSKYSWLIKCFVNSLMQQEPDIASCATRVVFPNKIIHCIVTLESCKSANKTRAHTQGRCRSGCTSVRQWDLLTFSHTEPWLQADPTPVLQSCMTGGDRTARPHPAQPFVSSVSMQMCPFLTEAFHLHGEEGAVKLPCLLETP